MALPRPEAFVAHVLPDGLPLIRDVVRDRIINVFGEPPINPEAEKGDPGLFGPGSASWRVLADPAAIAGGVRGLMLQTMHPGSMAGVHDHSSFVGDPLGRLQRTTSWVIASAFGSLAEVEHVARRVRATHPRVRGTTPGGQPYSAQDPRLLAWVQCALTTSFLATDAAYASSPASGADRDAFVLQQSVCASLLDPRVDLDSLDLATVREGTADLPMISEGTLPTTVAELDDVLAAFDWELEINHQAREALAYLKAPPLTPMLRVGYGIVYLGAVATFSESTRRRLGLPLPMPGSVAAATARLHIAALRTAAGRSQTFIDAETRALAA